MNVDILNVGCVLVLLVLWSYYWMAPKTDLNWQLTVLVGLHFCLNTLLNVYRNCWSLKPDKRLKHEQLIIVVTTKTMTKANVLK